MFDFIGMVITAALMVLVVNTLTTYMDTPRVAKTALAAVIGVLDRPRSGRGRCRVAPDLKTGPGGRALRGGTASRGGTRDRVAGSAQGDAEHTDASDGRA